MQHETRRRGERIESRRGHFIGANAKALRGCRAVPDLRGFAGGWFGIQDFSSCNHRMNLDE
jgi:hypothetical protein